MPRWKQSWEPWPKQGSLRRLVVWGTTMASRFNSCMCTIHDMHLHPDLMLILCLFPMMPSYSWETLCRLHWSWLLFIILRKLVCHVPSKQLDDMYASFYVQTDFPSERHLFMSELTRRSFWIAKGDEWLGKREHATCWELIHSTCGRRLSSRSSSSPTLDFVLMKWAVQSRSTY